jgi:hypothetical protein
VRGVAIADHVLRLRARADARHARALDEQLAFLREWVTWGAGPRASQFLVLGAKAHAALRGRSHVAIEDVRAVAAPGAAPPHRDELLGRGRGHDADTSSIAAAEVDPTAGVGARASRAVRRRGADARAANASAHADRRLDPAVLDRSRPGAGRAHGGRGLHGRHHRSPRAGSSVEFAQHREYVPGDELRRVDWKVFARSDRLVVKEFVEETNLVCHLLSTRASRWRTARSLDQVRVRALGASPRSRTSCCERDTAGLVVFEREGAHQGAAEERRRAGAQHLRRARGRAGRRTDGCRAGAALDLQRLRRRGIVAIFSDFFDDPEKIVDGLRRLVHQGHEPILFQVLDPLETTFDFDASCASTAWSRPAC